MLSPRIKANVVATNVIKVNLCVTEKAEQNTKVKLCITKDQLLFLPHGGNVVNILCFSVQSIQVTCFVKGPFHRLHYYFYIHFFEQHCVLFT